MENRTSPPPQDSQSNTDPDLIDVYDHTLAEVSEVDLYQKREKIYTRKIEGYFQRIREFTGWPLLAGFFLLPWINWGERQSVLFDLPERQFHIFGLTFWPQDLTLLALVLIFSAFLLFAMTNLAGRVWCGYSCPQTVWTSIFMWIEQKVEGTRNQRIRLDAAPWSGEKFLKKMLKHGLWLGVAFYTAFTFVGYFTPIDNLGYDFYRLDVSPWAFFWIAFFTLATYGNAGWLREQVCLYMCPYARFQAVMFDQDTLIISYDQERGEPRGSRKRNQDRNTTALGDCIDCELCVQVCPTGIDIRDGLQYECIGCALCIDACDSVMEKMNYPKGLVRYTTENALHNEPTKILRPRLIGYLAAVLIMALLLTYKIATRDTIELSVIRDRQALYTTNSAGHIENLYTLKIANKTQHEHGYDISIDSPLSLNYAGSHNIDIASGEVVEVIVRLSLPADAETLGSSPVTFKATRSDAPDSTASIESRFFAPSQ